MEQLSIAGVTDRAALLAIIRNCYCRLRLLRPMETAKRRWLYREISRVKVVLAADGVDREWLRLYCRQFASLDRAAAARFKAYSEKNYADLQKFLTA